MSSRNGTMPAGWVVRITIPDQIGAPDLPMFYAAMFPAPSKAVEAVKWRRHTLAPGEKYEAVKILGKLYNERRKLVGWRRSRDYAVMNCLRDPFQFAKLSDALVPEIGSRLPSDAAHYSDVDMISPADGRPAIHTRRDGTPYADVPRRGPEG